MVRIAGVTIPDNKQIAIALTYVYGIGHARAKEIVDAAHVTMQKKASELSNDELARLREIIEKTYKVEGELRRELASNIKHLKDAGTYRGTRHIKGLPLHGQRTRTNSRTRRGNVRHTATSGKRSVEKK